MAMVGVFAHAYVGNHGEPGHMFLDFTNRALDLAVVVPGLAALRVLARRNPEQDDGGQTGGIGLASLARDMVDRHLRHARHRADRLLDVASGADEVGLDKILGCEPRLADHAAERLVASQSSRPIYWKCHRSFPLGPKGRAQRIIFAPAIPANANYRRRGRVEINLSWRISCGRSLSTVSHKSLRSTL